MPTALATYGEREALTALYTALTHLQWRIPADLSLITAHHQSLVAGIRIEVCRIPTVETGAAAAQLLLQRMAGTKSCPSHVVPCDIVAGASVQTIGKS